MTKPLPEFEFPPLTEVALSVQFEKLEALHVPQLGLIWQDFGTRFPKIDEQPPLEPIFEQFGPRSHGIPGVKLELLKSPPIPRLWFLNDSGTELVQIQQDRFIRNWRKQDDNVKYPRYEQLRELFRNDLDVFCRLIEGQNLGRVEANQCELTYVNMIPAGNGWEHHGQLDQVFSLFRPEYNDSDLGTPDSASVNVKYLIADDEGNSVGRLHIDVDAVFRCSDNTPAWRMTLTARGIPDGDGSDGVIRFLDRCHCSIVQAFASVTTQKMHQIWKRVV